ncbi:proline-rich receptor-like protein kinase PERK2 [Aplysia californica]|uniref:Proline-rich receptor-like protein kinase PERK2 n=1 Tax=Aplysia californica TaxID=6500 RepID=A0ABM1AAF9_APLCA|nr:proline-rich receptor-like protein kinase PERK2 [Aplysia californica]
MSGFPPPPPGPGFPPPRYEVEKDSINANKLKQQPGTQTKAPNGTALPPPPPQPRYTYEYDMIEPPPPPTPPPFFPQAPPLAQEAPPLSPQPNYIAPPLALPPLPAPNLAPPLLNFPSNPAPPRPYFPTYPQNYNTFSNQIAPKQYYPLPPSRQPLFPAPRRQTPLLSSSSSSYFPQIPSRWPSYVPQRNFLNSYPRRAPVFRLQRDKGLSLLLRMTPFTTPQKRRQQMLNVLLILSAEELLCKTLYDAQKLEHATYYPSQCGKRPNCPVHLSNFMQIGQVCVCCPVEVAPRAISSIIYTKGINSYKEKLSNFGPGTD